MSRYFIFILFGFFFHTGALSQELRWMLQLTKEVKGAFDLFDVDEGGSLYLLTTGGQLKKYNANIDSLAVFNEVRRYGKLHSIHTQNALKTYLFFKNFNVVLILDRMMQLVQKIDLRKSGLFQINSICPSYDNQLWIFDEQNAKIKKIRLDGTVAFESTDLRLVFSEKLSPQKLIEHQGYLYLMDPKQGIYVFDYYGGFKEKIPVTNAIALQSLGKDLMYSNNHETWMLRADKNEVICRLINEQPLAARQTYFSPRLVYVLGARGISIFSYHINQQP